MEPKMLEKARFYAILNGMNFESKIDITKYFIAESNNSNSPNSIFKGNMAIITILRSHDVMKNTKYYAKFTQKSFTNHIDLAKY